MKLLAWLRTFLRRSAPATQPFQQPAAPVKQGYSSGPLVPLPRLTPTQREERAQAREPYISEAIATSQQQQAQASDLPDAIKYLSAEQLRLNIEQQYLRADLEEAQGMGWVVDELHLRLELLQREAALDLHLWRNALVQRYGPEVGGKLCQHEVEAGMRLEHVAACYGIPPAGAITRLSTQPDHLLIQYGSTATGSYFELVDGVVTVARLGRPTLPPFVLEGYYASK